jgi:hypothetical protein
MILDVLVDLSMNLDILVDLSMSNVWIYLYVISAMIIVIYNACDQYYGMHILPMIFGDF